MSVIGKKLVRETFIYSIGSFGSKILSFLLIPFYTYFLTKKDLGEYDIFITSVSLIIPLVSLQTSDSVYRWLISSLDINSRKQIISNNLIILLTSILLFLIIYAIIEIFIDVNYSIYFVLLIILNSFLPFLQNILRGIGETKKYTLSGLMTTFFTVSLTFILIYFFRMNIKGILIANVLSYVLTCVIISYQTKIFRFIDFKLLNKEFLKKTLSYSVPLIPNLMSWWVISSASKFIIMDHLGTEANGLYAVSSRFPALLLVVNSVLLLPMQDAILKDTDDNIFNKLFLKFVIFEIVLATILGLCSPLLTKLLVADSFFESWEYMPILYLGVAFNAIAAFLGLHYQKKKNTLKITLTTIVGALFSVGTSFLLVDKMGLQGISLSFMIGFFIMFLLRFIDVFKKNRLKKFLPVILIITSISLFIIGMLLFYL